MRLLLFLLAIAVLSPGAAAATERLEAGPLVVAMDRGGESCSSPPDPGCLARHEPGGPDAGDDRVDVRQRVHRVAAEARVPGAPSEEVSLDLADADAAHPLAGPLAAALDAPEAVPGAPDAGVDDRGVFVVVPTVVLSEGTLDHRPRYVHWNDDVVNRSHVHAPYTTYGVTFDSSDGLFEMWIYRSCLGGLPLPPLVACAPEAVAEGADAARGALPEVRFGAEADRINVALAGALGAAPVASSSTPGLDLDTVSGPPASAALPGGSLAHGGTGQPSAWWPPRALASPAAAAEPQVSSRAVAFAEQRRDDGLGWLAAPAAVLLLSGLYHRIVAHRALAQATRRRIYEAVAAEPGLRIGTLQQRLGLDYKTVQRHVRLLASLGLLQPVGEGQRRYFPTGALDPRGQERVVALACPASRAILEHLVARGPADLSALRAALALPASTASVAVVRLARAGLVVKHRIRGRVLVEATGQGHEAPRAPGQPGVPTAA